ncbi:MAG: glycosyltransferase family 4 protein [Bacteroidales bacterium]|nr:glycosyltransferase family 4 protein [Bacteroidales bacterium]
MRLIYYSHPYFADCDFPLIREYQRRGIDVWYFMDLSVFGLHYTLVDIKQQLKETDILHASVYTELLEYKSYIDYSHFFIINRPHPRDVHPLNIWVKLKLAWRFWKLKPDAIHATSFMPFDSWLYKFQKNVILTIHDPFLHSGEASQRELKLRQTAISNINKFILLNEIQKNVFVDFHRLNPNRVICNRLGNFDYSLLSFGRDKEVFQTDLKILFFGRISPYKGIEYLLKASKYLYNKGYNIKLVIAGSGSLYFDYTPYLSETYITLINRYIGTTELAELLYDCDVVVCPYTDATQSGVVLTAFSMEKPVVASNVGGMGEYIESGKSGLLVPPCDSDALSSVLESLITDKDIIPTMVNYLKEKHQQQNKMWETIANTNIQFYNAQ